MSEPINIYCDESCHLENDQQPLMVLGAVWCPADRTAEIAKRLRELKSKHRWCWPFGLDTSSCGQRFSFNTNMNGKNSIADMQPPKKTDAAPRDGIVTLSACLATCGR